MGNSKQSLGARRPGAIGVHSVQRQGVGWAMKPRRMLRPGDKVRLAIDKLGEQEQLVTSG